MVQVPAYKNNGKVTSDFVSIPKENQNLTNLPTTRLFGTDGIRGKVGELLTPNLALAIGKAAGKVLKELSNTSNIVIIGQDSRNSSDMLAMACGAGLTSAGLDVWNLGLCPTPAVAHLTRKTTAIGGIMISASHNPPEDNGIKFFGNDGTKLSTILTEKIEAVIRNNFLSKDLVDSEKELVDSSKFWGKSYQRHELVDDYIHSLKNSFASNINLKGIRVVLDLAWGASVETAPSIFKALGAEVITINDLPDGNRINVNCGSTHLDNLIAAVSHYEADLGFAFDGDADRVMAVDGKGRVVNGDYILYLWGNLLRQQELLPDNTIVTTVMANLGFEKAWEKLGGKLIRTSVGDSHVQAQMWLTGAMLGGEQSGHILCHHHNVSGDGVQTALHLTALVCQSGLSLEELVDNSFETYPQLLRNVRVENRDRRLNWQNCQELIEAISSAEKAMDSVGRVLVRASGTEPVIRVMVEAYSQDLAQYWNQFLVNVVEQHLAV